MKVTATIEWGHNERIVIESDSPEEVAAAVVLYNAMRLALAGLNESPPESLDAMLVEARNEVARLLPNVSLQQAASSVRI